MKNKDVKKAVKDFEKDLKFEKEICCRILYLNEIMADLKKRFGEFNTSRGRE